MNWYNPTFGGSTTPAGLRGSDGDAMNGIAVMYDAVAGKIFSAGGAPSYQVSELLPPCGQDQDLGPVELPMSSSIVILTLTLDRTYATLAVTFGLI
jgi:hypothetical protein